GSRPANRSLSDHGSSRYRPTHARLSLSSQIHKHWVIVSLRDNTWLDGAGWWHVEGKQLTAGRPGNAGTHIVGYNCLQPSVSEQDGSQQSERKLLIPIPFYLRV